MNKYGSTKVFVHLKSIAESLPDATKNDLYPVNYLRSIALLDEVKRFILVDDPAAADFVVFVENHSDNSPAGPYLSKIQRDPVYRRFKEKCFVHYGADRPVALIPGIYPSIDRNWAWRGIARSGCYIVPRNPYLQYSVVPDAPKYLGSFIGCVRGIPLRHRIIRVNDDRLHCSDNSASFIAAIRSGNEKEIERIKRQFVEVCMQSKFVLCPRGFGSSSIRLYEAMEMGRCPVVFSDQWVPPDGPDWSSFLLRVKEKDVHRIPYILRDHEPFAEKMGELARRAWEDWFGPSKLFHRTCESVFDMMQIGWYKRNLLCTSSYINFARPLHLKFLFRKCKIAISRSWKPTVP